jgi:hypothetical protein
MLLTKDSFYQGKKDGLYGVSDRTAKEHASLYDGHAISNYWQGFICGSRARSQAIIEHRQFWNDSAVLEITA